MGCRPSSPEVHPQIEPDITIDGSSDSGKARGGRPSIVSLQIPKDYPDDMSSDGMSDRSLDGHENMDYLCGTDVSLQWLIQRLYDKIGKRQEEEPQWITERLNRPSWDDYATSAVIRVTFSWEEEGLPKSVVLKVPLSKELREDDEGKYHYIMFKRECNVYEWTQKFSKLCSPTIYHIKRHSKEGSGVVVMEDVGEKGVQQDPTKGLSVEVVRDLLKHLAYLHAHSLKQTSWSTLIADLPPSYYTHIIGDFDKTMEFFEHNDVDHSRFVETAKFFTMEYLHSTATESVEELQIPKVLVHGEPYAANVYTPHDSSDQSVIAVIDWTECHSGCFAEDVAKAICWNLAPKDRLECTSSLLESYHYHLTKESGGETQLSVDVIRKSYERFIPFAMVTLLGKVMLVRHKSDVEPLVERAKGLLQNVYATEKLMQDS